VEPTVCEQVDAGDIAPQRYPPGSTRDACTWESPPLGELSIEAQYGDDLGNLTLRFYPVALDQPGQSP